MFGGTPGTSTHYITAAIDGNDLIHAAAMYVSAGSVTRVVAYSTFNIGTETWASWESVLGAFSQTPNANQFSLDIFTDTSDFPHLIFTDAQKVHGTAYNYIYYSNRTGGSWSTPEQVNSGTGIDCQGGSAELDASGNAYIVFDDNTTPLIRYNSRPSGGSWGTDGSYTGSFVAGRNAIIPSATVRRYYANGTTYYEGAGSTGITNATFLTQAGAHYEGTTRWLVVGYQASTPFYWRIYSNSSGSSTFTLQATGTVGDARYVNTAWQNNNNFIPAGYVPFVFQVNNAASGTVYFESYPDLPGPRRIFITV